MENLTGQTIKGYKLEERIGAGGFGAVYRARQTTVEREVAVKIILPGFANKPDFIRRFEAEAQIIANLEHLHITPLYDFWRDPEGAYLVMRYLRGGSLRESLQSGPYELPMAASLLDQIASALAMAHRNDIIHRDIKPGNILMDEDGNAYLADFGISKVLGELPGDLTEGGVVGSLEYISPEQARSEPVSYQTDIYSLGVVIYELLTGEHPFSGSTPVECLYKHLNEPLPLVSNLNGEAEAVNALIQKATAKNPARRYADVLELAAEFRQAVNISPAAAGEQLVEQLTMREQEVLRLVVEGKSNREIAQDLFITLSTVKWYVNQIYRKLGVRNRVQAIVRARELNLVIPGSIAGEIALDGSDAASVSLPEPENPYKGLRAFQAADHRHFFGREALVEKLLSRMSGGGNGSGRFLAVVGPSGSGKSSVVKAGLVPALWRGDLPGSERWFVVEMIPGDHPLDELEIALLRVATDQSGNLNEQLSRDARGLNRVSRLILPEDDSELVIVIDQFEEMFTLVEDEADRAKFLDLLQTAVAAPRSRVRVVVTLRADFFDRPLHYPDFGELVREHMVTILPLSAEELTRAIRKPAEMAGVALEEGLVPTIIDEIHYQPGALPLLQYALTELFDRREGRLLTRRAYAEMGGTVGALARRAEEIFENLDEPGRQAARQMFLRLVTLGEGVEDTRRRVPRSELLAITTAAEMRVDGPSGGEDLMDELIDTYASYRLLSLDNDPATRIPTVEVAHEAILREWERLRGWLNDSREDIRQQRQLSRVAREWRAGGKEPSFLLHGARLEQFESWRSETALALTPGEDAFLVASLAAREERAEAEAERQAREERLEIRGRNFLRALVGVFAIATIVALFLSNFAFNQRDLFQEESLAHATAQADAEAAQGIAEDNAALAAASAAEAQAEAEARATAQAEAEAAKDFAEAQREKAEEQAAVSAREAQVNHSLLLAEQSKAALEAANFDLALALAFAANQIEDPPGRAQMALSEAAYTPGGTIRLFEGHDPEGRVFGVDISPDGKHMLSGSESGEVFLWDLASGEIVRRLEGHTSDVWRVAISPDGRYGLSGDLTHLIYWDLETGAPIHTMTDIGQVGDVYFSPDGRIAATSHGGSALGGEPLVDDNSLRFWDLESGAEIRRVEFGSPVRGMAFSPDGERIAAISREREVAISGDGVIVLEVATGETLLQVGQEIADLNAVTFGPDGSYLIVTGLAAGSQGWGPVKIDLETGEEFPFDEGHNTSAVGQVKISPDGKRVVSVGGGYQVYDLESRDQLWKGPTGNTDIAFLPDGSGVVVTQDDILLLVALENGGLADGPQLPSINNNVGGLAYSPDGLRALVTGQGNGFLGEYDLETGTLIRPYERDPEAVPSAVRVTYSPDGKTALSANYLDQSLSYWDVETGQEIYKLSQSPGRPWAVAFHPSGDYALSAGSFAGQEATSVNQLAYWDLRTGEQVWTVDPEYTVILRGAAINPNGETALTGGIVGGFIAGVLDMWDLATGTQIMTLEGHGHLIWDIEYVDEKTALTSSEDTTLILWDLETGKPIRYFYGHTRGIKEIALNPDHSLAASISRDGTVIVWDIATGQPIRRYHGHPGAVSTVAFSPDGLEVMSGGQFGEIFRWRVDETLDELMAWVLENRYVQEFTCVERIIYNITPLCEE